MIDSQPESERIEDLAATWAIRHEAGMTPAEREDFEQWLEADPRHFAAFAEADLALSVLRGPQDARRREQLRDEIVVWEAKRQLRRGRRRVIGFAAMGLAAAAAIVFAFLPAVSHRVPAPAPVAVTMTVGPRVQTLTDGSVVEINGDAQIAVDFSREIRGVRLLRGEAHFDVAKDAARPFVVSVGAVKVRAVGTGFNVRLEPTEVRILVTEGTVAIAASATVTEDATVIRARDDGREDDGETPATSLSSLGVRADHSDITVTAGHRTIIPLAAENAPPSSVSVVSPEDMQRELAWRKIRFELSNATLEEAIALFNRKGTVQLAIGDSELRHRRISGIYRADNPVQFAELIEATLDIKAKRQAPDRIVFHRR